MQTHQILIDDNPLRLQEMYYVPKTARHPSTGEQLFTILKKLHHEKSLNPSEIQYLSDQELCHISIFAHKLTKHQMEDFGVLQEGYFHWLKIHYGIETEWIHFVEWALSINQPHQFSITPAYTVLDKLEQHTRLTPKEVVWLQERDLLSRHVLQVYHTIEAQFYEHEYRKTQNLWNLVNASSHWRDAEKSERALAITEDIISEEIADKRLLSAILTTQGGALRDLHRVVQRTKKCARQAMEYSPASYQPYTLLGAVCYDEHNYSEGDQWFQKALERGANREGIDNEIKRIIRRIHGKERHTLLRHLVNIDPKRFAWAKKELFQQKTMTRNRSH